MITVAKGIGNGFPMAGVLISPKFKPVYGQLGTTFGGNHLACAAAIAVLDVMKGENLVENAAKVGAHLLKELKQFPQIKEVREADLLVHVVDISHPTFEEQIEVVVTALGIKRKDKSLGYVAEKVTSEEFEKTQNNNWAQALEGKVAGLKIQTAGAGPLGSAKITLRGIFGNNYFII
jgi:glutamate-1-semialdehyde aminotransferase